MFALNDSTGYFPPHTLNFMDPPYLYLSFLPYDFASQQMILGFQINGKVVAWVCDISGGYNYISLFPNFQEKAPAPLGNGWNAAGTVCDRMKDERLHMPSSRAMPVDFFMFTQMQFICGCYGQTDYKSNQILATALGFK